MKKLFAFLALLVCLLSAPLANAGHTYYVDIADKGWSDVYLYVKNGTNDRDGGYAWGGPYKGELVAGTTSIYKVFSDWGTVEMACFSKSNAFGGHWYFDGESDKDFGATTVGILKVGSTGNMKLQDGYVYKLASGNTNGITKSYKFDPENPYGTPALPDSEISNITLTRTGSSTAVGTFTQVIDDIYMWHGSVIKSDGGTWYQVQTKDTNNNVKTWAIPNTSWWWTDGNKTSSASSLQEQNLVNIGSNDYKFCFSYTSSPYIYVRLSADKKSLTKIFYSLTQLNFRTLKGLQLMMGSAAGSTFTPVAGSATSVAELNYSVTEANMGKYFYVKATWSDGSTSSYIYANQSSSTAINAAAMTATAGTPSNNNQLFRFNSSEVKSATIKVSTDFKLTTTVTKYRKVNLNWSDPASTYNGTTKTITATYTSGTDFQYSLDGGATWTKGGTTSCAITIGNPDATANQTITIQYKASIDKDTANGTRTYTLKYVDPSLKHLYITGAAVGGWAPKAPLEFTYSKANNWFTIKIPSTGNFKISTTYDANASGDGWAEFNAGAYQLSNTSEKLDNNWRTLKKWVDGDFTAANFNKSKAYTLYVKGDYSQIMAVPDPDPLYILGGGHQWTDPGNPDKFTYDKTNNVYYTDVQLENGSIQITDSKGSWDDLKAGAYKVNIGDNVTFTLGKWENISRVGCDAQIFSTHFTNTVGRYRIFVKADFSQMMVQSAPLGVYPRQAADAGNDFKAWKDPAVYVTANYLNANRLSPDWEMVRQSDGTYTLEAVTLRGAQKDNGADADPTLTVHVLTPSAAGDGSYTEKTYELLGSKISGLETASEQQIGRSYDLKFSGTTLTATPNKTYGTKMPFISLVGTNYVQENPGTTPRCKSTDDGWQESWVLYDANSHPVRDVAGNYIYSTQWPPREENSIYFQANLNDETIGVTSDGLVFDLDTTHPADGDLTGADWMSILKAESPVAYDRIQKVKTLDENSNETLEANPTTCWLDGTTKYARYVVNNVWVLGATKIWTGWGGQTINGGANWSNHANWGFKDHDKKADDSGYTVKASRAYTMGNQYSNFLFAKPTYFRTVEFFLPIDADGNIDHAKQNQAVLLTTQTIGDIQINAKVYSRPGTDGEKNSGQYIPTMDLDQMLGYTYKRHRISRYDANKSDIADQSSWTPAGSDYRGPWVTNETALTTGSAWTPDWRTDRNLGEGRYFYVLEVEFEKDGKTVVERVPSPYFTIFFFNYETDPQAFQVIKIWNNDKTRESLAAVHSSLASYVNKSVAYDPEVELFYVIDTDDASPNKGVGTEIPYANSQRLLKWIRDEKNTKFYRWTADVWVKAFDANSYRERCRLAAADEGLADRWFNTDPYELTVYVHRQGKHAVRTQPAHVNRANLIYSALIKNHGNLDEADYHASLGYETYMSNSVALDGDASREEWETMPFDHIVPVVPMPALLSYSYKLDETGKADPITDAPELQLQIKSQLDPIEGYNYEMVDGKQVDKYLTVTLPAGDLRCRNLAAEFQFYQPNVDDEILTYYDIEYDVELASYDGDGNRIESLAEGTYYDIQEDDKFEIEPYVFTIDKVHPTNERNPRLTIQRVIYKPNINAIGDDSPAGYGDTLIGSYYGVDADGNSNWNGTFRQEDVTEEVENEDGTKETVTNTYTSVRLIAPSEFKETKPMHMSSIFVNRDAEYTDDSGRAVVDFAMKGHKDLTDAQGEVGDQDPDVEFEVMTPTFYHIESLYTNGTEKIPYAMEFFTVHDQSKYGCSQAELDKNPALLPSPTMHQTIAKGIPAEVLNNPEHLSFFISPIYILRRDPDLPAAASIEGLEPVPHDGQVHEEPASAPKRVSETPYGQEGGTLVAIHGESIKKVADGGITGVENVNAAAIDYDAEYYTVSGIRVMEPREGEIYIVRRGAVVTKELIK